MKLHKYAAALMLSIIFSSAQAALYDRGGGLIYDDALNITWLQDANYAKTSGYDDDGLMSWVNANSWASSLVYGGYSDWRLPVSDTTCYRGDVVGKCTSSEMGNLYQMTLGNVSAYESGATGYGLKNVGPFENLYEGHGYWSMTEFTGNQPTDYAFYFHFAGGGQAYSGKASLHYAWAVRDGDVTQVSTVPAPSAFILLLTGLGLLGAMTRRGNH